MIGEHIKWIDKKTGDEVLFATPDGQTKDDHVLLYAGHTTDALKDYPPGTKGVVMGGDVFVWVPRGSVELVREVKP